MIQEDKGLFCLFLSTSMFLLQEPTLYEIQKKLGEENAFAGISSGFSVEGRKNKAIYW